MLIWGFSLLGIEVGLFVVWLFEVCLSAGGFDICYFDLLFGIGGFVTTDETYLTLSFCYDVISSCSTTLTFPVIDTSFLRFDSAGLLWVMFLFWDMYFLLLSEVLIFCYDAGLLLILMLDVGILISGSLLSFSASN